MGNKEPKSSADSGVTIAVIADVHLGQASEMTARRCEIADVLLSRAVYRINKLIRPDVTLVLGDVIDDGESPNAEANLQRTRDILDRLDKPCIAIPGNHDGDVAQFYRVFDRPKDMEDIAGVRFLPFIDKAEPRHDASRSDADLERIRKARHGYAGPIVSCQHVCLFPPREEREPPYYNFTNAEEVISTLHEAGVTLSVSGHYHKGVDDMHDGDLTFVNAPGLCEAPHPILEIHLDGTTVTTKRHELVMPRELNLCDNHLHTQLAYCSQNMDVEKAIALAHDFGLSGITFTEHSGQLYFARKPYWRGAWAKDGMDAADEAHNRMAQYLVLKDRYEDDFTHFSLEAECDSHGRLVLKPDIPGQFSFLMGTVHKLAGLSEEIAPTQRESDDFLAQVDALGKAGVKVLAHPLRVFGRAGWDTPPELLEPTADLLCKHGVAAEINFHSSHQPLPAFIKACLDRGVKFSFGSDAHDLAEIGDFAYHIALLREAGFDGDLADVLVDLR